MDRLDRTEIFRSILRGQGVKLEKSSEEEKERAKRYMNQALRDIKNEIPELVVLIKLFTLKAVDLPINVSSDFRYMFYSPRLINKLGRTGKPGMDEIEFQIMHVILHGLLGDNESVKYARQSKAAWLAMDQRVNDICNQLGILPKSNDIHKQLIRMKKTRPFDVCFGNIVITEKNKLVRKKAKAAQRAIASDEHFFWNPIFVKKLLGEEYDTGEGAEGKGASGNGIEKDWENARSSFMGERQKCNRTKNGNDANEFTKNIMKRCQGKNAGKGSGDLHEEITAAEGEAIDYKKLLNEILTEADCQMEIPDSYDPMLYQYGLDLYGDTPLIEPREEGEYKSLHTLVVAIDTSGSCSGEVAMTFLREVNSLLRESARGFKSGEVLLLQCDDEIQNEELIDIRDMNDSITDTKLLSGWGGTSFIPVFDRIQELQETEDKIIDGLFYLTDGWGCYPNDEPNYPTIFVMNEWDYQGVSQYKPEWIRVGLIEE